MTADLELPHEAFVAALASLDRVGPSRLRWLLSMGTPQQAWERVLVGRLPEVPRRIAGTEASLGTKWRAGAAKITPAGLWRRCAELGIGVVTLGGAGYPPALANDLDPPVVLFHRGDVDVLTAPRVAIIGTRKATGYGRRHARVFAAHLSGAGVSVVSGLALGIDAAAHAGAVDSGGAPPIGIVGGGLDNPCPRRNLALAEQVATRGVLLSEVPPGVAASPWRFPVRNRIIAAAAQAVVVVESAGAGGSMHTVREAMRRDVPVLAVPGPIDSRVSDGTNELIADGALVCRNVDDILMAIGHVASAPDAVGVRSASVERRAAPVGDAASVLDQLGWRPMSVEQVAGASGLGLASVAAALFQLEADDWVRRSGGWIERVARVPGPHGGAA